MAVALCAIIFCISACVQKKDNTTVHVGFSQAMLTDDWREQMNKSMEIEASLHPEVQLQMEDAGNNVKKQINDIKGFISNGTDIIIVSPIESAPLTPVVREAINKGIPVLVVDRKIEGEDYTAYLGADNVEVGRIAAQYIAANSKKNARVIEITGLKTSSPAYERSLGFSQALARFPTLTLAGVINGNWEGASIKKPLQALLQQQPNVEYIFAHNDRMALSAWETLHTLGLDKHIKIIGVDALNTANGGIDLVKNGTLTASILYPTGGNEALKLALRIHHKNSFPKNNLLNTIVVDHTNAEIIKNQLDKIDQQQDIVEQQLNAIKVQEQEYASQNNLVRILTLFLVIILGLALYSVYSTLFISRKKNELERINQTVVTQKNEIEAMAAAAQRSNDAKISFFTGLSHEFKTPLTLILSYAESLLENDKIKVSRVNEEVKLIYSNATRLLQLINQLLDFRKIEEHKFTLRAAPTNIHDFTAAVMANFKGEALRRNIDFKLLCEYPDTLLYLDRNLMDKVYFNLLSNAFKFTPDNGKITIAIKNDNPDTVTILVSDNGIGIPQQELPQVFLPFFKASNNNKSSSGIGLNISREFIQLHGGSIAVHSRQGTEFLITLKTGSAHLHPEEIMLTPAGDNHKPGSVIPEIPLPGLNNNTSADNKSDKPVVLVVEDHPDLIEFLQTKLADAYEVLVSDGSDAVAIALKTIPDILVCDINLIGNDGFEITRELKKDLRTSHIPIIILSAQSSKDSVIKALSAGVDQYLTKPFSLSVLKHSLSSLLFNREKLRYYYTNNIYRVEPDTKFGQPEQNFVSRMNGIIMDCIDDPKFSVEELAEKLNVSRVQLYRKVKAILGINISDHINNIRLERAALLLREGELNISEVAYSLGFSSPNYFSTSFKNKFGVAPKEYRVNG